MTPTISTRDNARCWITASYSVVLKTNPNALFVKNKLHVTVARGMLSIFRANVVTTRTCLPQSTVETHRRSRPNPSRFYKPSQLAELTRSDTVAIERVKSMLSNNWAVPGFSPPASFLDRTILTWRKRLRHIEPQPHNERRFAKM